ncbi:MAG TPA: hypothetical protein DDZ81_08720 [Acetobacteraceae bacterium]|jgi:hypothetical protein|nr:hypothetical protein [Acetobacteraceae bacterium]
MSHSNAFALKNSGFNEFLFAEVGTEQNGSRLTILSVLARLGQDPWAEAARWARLPKAAMIDCLANSISQMPLSPQALNQAHNTAAQLVLLMPSQTQPVPEARKPAITLPTAVPRWLLGVLVAGLAFGLAVSVARLTFPADPGASLAGHALQQTDASKATGQMPSIQ